MLNLLQGVALFAVVSAGVAGTVVTLEVNFVETGLQAFDGLVDVDGVVVEGFQLFPVSSVGATDVLHSPTFGRVLSLDGVEVVVVEDSIGSIVLLGGLVCSIEGDIGTPSLLEGSDDLVDSFVALDGSGIVLQLLGVAQQSGQSAVRSAECATEFVVEVDSVLEGIALGYTSLDVLCGSLDFGDQSQSLVCGFEFFHLVNAAVEVVDLGGGSLGDECVLSIDGSHHLLLSFLNHLVVEFEGVACIGNLHVVPENPLVGAVAADTDAEIAGFAEINLHLALVEGLAGQGVVHAEVNLSASHAVGHIDGLTILIDGSVAEGCCIVEDLLAVLVRTRTVHAADAGEACSAVAGIELDGGLGEAVVQTCEALDRDVVHASGHVRNNLIEVEVLVPGLYFVVIHTVEHGPSVAAIQGPTLQAVVEAGVLEQQGEVITGLHVVALDEVENQLLNVILALVDFLSGEGVADELGLEFGVVLIHGVGQFCPAFVLEHLLQQTLKFSASAEVNFEFLISLGRSVEGIGSSLDGIAGSKSCLVVRIAVEDSSSFFDALSESLEIIDICGHVGVNVLCILDSLLQFSLSKGPFGLAIVEDLEVISGNPVCIRSLDFQTEGEFVGTIVYIGNSEVLNTQTDGLHRSSLFTFARLDEDVNTFDICSVARGGIVTSCSIQFEDIFTSR